MFFVGFRLEIFVLVQHYVDVFGLIYRDWNAPVEYVNK